MDKKGFVEELLETENLTDDLEDRDARRLLEWGIARLEVILQDAVDEPAARDKVTALKNLLRHINQGAGSKLLQNKGPERAANIAQFVDEAGGNFLAGVVGDHGHLLLRLHAQTHVHGIESAWKKFGVKRSGSQICSHDQAAPAPAFSLRPAWVS